MRRKDYHVEKGPCGCLFLYLPSLMHSLRARNYVHTSTTSLRSISFPSGSMYRVLWILSCLDAVAFLSQHLLLWLTKKLFHYQIVHIGFCFISWSLFCLMILNETGEPTSKLPRYVCTCYSFKVHPISMPWDPNILYPTSSLPLLQVDACEDK